MLLIHENVISTYLQEQERRRREEERIRQEQERVREQERIRQEQERLKQVKYLLHNLGTKIIETSFGCRLEILKSRC